MLLRIDTVLQRAEWDCGIACARMAFAHYSVPQPPDIENYGSPMHGTDPAALQCLFRNNGLTCVSGEMDVGDLAYHASRGRPVICLVNRGGIGHYVVSRGVNPSGVHFADPYSGPEKLGKKAWNRAWRDVGEMGTHFVKWGCAVGPLTRPKAKP